VYLGVLLELVRGRASARHGSVQSRSSAPTRCSAERRSDGAAAARQERARPAGRTPATRRTRRGTPNIDPATSITSAEWRCASARAPRAGAERSTVATEYCAADSAAGAPPATQASAATASTGAAAATTGAARSAFVSAAGKCGRQPWHMRHRQRRPAPAPPPPKKPPPKPGEKQEEKKYRNAIQLSRKNDTGRHEGGPLVLKLLPDQCISTFLNCQGSRLSMSSGKRPGRPVRGVQSV
jgi:hypothetical protein